MKKNLIKIAIFFLCLVFMMPITSVQATTTKNILFLSSYTYEWPSTKGQIKGYESIMDGKANTHYYFMDTKNVAIDIADKRTYGAVTQLMKTQKYDLIVIADDAALGFATKYHDELFANVPMVYSGINNANNAQLAHQKYKNMTGLIETYPIADTIKIASKIQTDAKNVVAILDDTLTGKGAYDQFMAVKSQFPSLKFSTLDTSLLTKKEIQNQVSHYTDDTILLYLLVSEDKEGNTYSFYDGVSLFYKAAKIPIFHADESGVGDGLFGGCLISYTKMGKMAGNMVEKIFKGTSPSSIDVKTMPSVYMFDENLVKKYSIDESLLPKGTIYVNQEVSFFEKHKDVVVPLSIVILFLIAGLVLTFSNNRHRKHLNDKLAEKENLLLEAISRSAMSFWIYYPATHIADTTEVLPSFKRSLSNGNIIENYPQCNVDDQIVYPEDINAYLKAFHKIDAGEKESAATVRVLQEGHYVWFDMHLTSLYDETGKQTKVICTAINIQKQKEAEFRFSRFNEDVVKKAGNFLYTYRLNLTQNICFEGTSSYASLLRLGRGHTVDSLFQAIIRYDAKNTDIIREFNRNTLMNAFNSGIIEVNHDHRCLVDEYGIIWIRTYIHMNENPTTGDIECLMYSININDSRILQSIIDDAIELDYDFMALINASSKSLTTFSDRGNKNLSFLYQQPNYEEAMQVALDLYIKEEDQEKFLHDYAIPTILMNLENENDYISYMNMTVGERHLIKKLRFSYIDKENKNILLTETDVTDVYEKERKANEDLKKALDEAKEANEAKSDFLSNISHDMRTPLNGILGFTSLALENKDEKVREDYLNKIKVSGDLLLNLINDTLELSRIESGKIILKEEVIESQKLLESVTTGIQAMAEEKEIIFTTDVDQDIPDYILGDELKLQEVVLNLLSNAMKFTHPHGHVHLAIHYHDNDHYEIIVKDDGIGISKQFLKHIGEPFMQENDPTIKNVTGTGLGLSIVKKIITMMNGELLVKSKKGYGSTFTVRLKIPRVDKGGASSIKEVKLLENLKEKKILLCEDNILNSEIAKTILEKNGMIVTTAFNGQEGVELFEASALHEYEAILMDLRMPVMNGYQAAQAIRELSRADAKDIPIIALTADAFEENKKQALEAGMNGFIIKPINVTTLLEELSHCIKA